MVSLLLFSFSSPPFPVVPEWSPLGDSLFCITPVHSIAIFFLLCLLTNANCLFRLIVNTSMPFPAPNYIITLKLVSPLHSAIGMVSPVFHFKYICSPPLVLYAFLLSLCMRLVSPLLFLLPLHHVMMCASHGACCLVVPLLATEPVVMTTAAMLPSEMMGGLGRI